MKHNTNNPTTFLTRWARFLGAMLVVALTIPAIAVSQVAPNLGTSNSFGILAAGAITGSTTVTGNVGTSTADAIAGSIAVAAGYTKYDPADAVAIAAHNDFLTAYSDVITNNLGGTVLPAAFPGGGIGNAVGNPLTPGVYEITSPASMTADLYLSGSGIYIFKTSTSLNTTAATVVHLANGAVWSDIYWQVGAAVTLGAGSSVFEGTILCNSAVTVGAPATVNGRLLSNGAVSVSTATIGAADIPFPVELTAFTATANRTNVELRWSTATEVNNYGFEIERSQSADWQKVGFVGGAGTSNSPKEYSFSDGNISSGKYSYRLKQIDRDGQFEYSQSVEVNIGQAPQKFALMQNHPNPFNPSTKIQYSLENAGMVSLKVYNIIGNEVATLVNGNQEAGSYSVPFSTNNGTVSLSSGVYFYRLEAGPFVSTKKLVLMK